MTVLVTGAAGFAGSHLLEHLAFQASGRTGQPAAPPAHLVAWARSAPPAELAGLARWTAIDLLDRDAVRQAIAALRPVQVYHCAGAAHVGDSWTRTTATLSANVLATHYLFDAIRRAGITCRVLVPGSAHVYAPSLLPIAEDAPLAPASPYALSKLAQELVSAQAFVRDGSETILTRVFNHCGPRQSPSFAAASMARQVALIEHGALPPVIKVGNLDTVRDLTDVRDTVRAYAMLMDRGVPGSICNVASGVARPTRAVLDTLLSHARVPVRVEVDPARLRPHDIPVLVGDPSRLRQTTGWSPRFPFEQMLKDLLDYWRGQTPAVARPEVRPR
jgi:GDP-4-dehydro-6-deoxy-D-mannose reductase